jgi:hypothetical protein
MDHRSRGAPAGRTPHRSRASLTSIGRRGQTPQIVGPRRHLESSRAIRFNKEAIKTWAEAATAGQTKAFTYEAGRAIGHGVVRSTNQVHQMSKVAVVLKKVVDQNRIYFVLTSYPKPF